MLEPGKRSLLLEAVTSTFNDLAECYEILTKEHGEKYAELKVENLIAFKTLEQEGETKVLEDAPEKAETKVLENYSTDESRDSNYAPEEGETKVLEDASTNESKDSNHAPGEGETKVLEYTPEEEETKALDDASTACDESKGLRLRPWGGKKQGAGGRPREGGNQGTGGRIHHL